MAHRAKRKSFGLSKKKACDAHHCLKKKKSPSNLTPAESGIKHLRVNNS